MEGSSASYMKVALRPLIWVRNTATRWRHTLLPVSLLILALVAFLNRTPSTAIHRNPSSLDRHEASGPRHVHIRSVSNCIGCSAWDAARPVESLPGRDVYTQLAHVFSEQNIRTRCRRLAFPGGKCSCDGSAVDGTCTHLAALDGKKPVCLDSELLPEAAPCLVYSFGVRTDPSFEGEMARLGCEVHAFDPTIPPLTPPALPEGVRHHRVGIDGRTWTYRGGDGRAFSLMTLDDLRAALGHQGRRIDYVKLDAEGSEWSALQHQLTSDAAALQDVTQVHIEFHLMLPHGRLSADSKWRHQLVEEDARQCLRVVTALQEAGFKMAHTRSMGTFPGIGVAHVYETLWMRRG